jgi:hypothetical protein
MIIGPPLKFHGTRDILAPILPRQIPNGGLSAREEARDS